MTAVSAEPERNAFLYNAWYCASWAHELGQALLARTLLDIPVVLYRKLDGTPAALKDECPHRFAPLSRGKRDGDALVCHYHGLRFTAEGVCDDPRYPDKARQGPCLRAFPVLEKHNIIWIWMGDPARARAADIPDYRFFDAPERPKFFGYTSVQANYELEIDNLLDLSHLDYVHTASIAQDLSRVGRFEVERDVQRIASLWRAEDVPLPALWAPFFPGDNVRLDMWMDMHWRPASNLLLDTGNKRAGAARDESIGTLQGHFVTPESRKNTHYFWGVTTHPAMGPIIEQVRLGTIQAFEQEDQPLLEAVQRRMGDEDFWSKRPLVLLADGGSVSARRMLNKLIRQEMADAAHPPMRLHSGELHV